MVSLLAACSFDGAGFGDLSGKLDGSETLDPGGAVADPTDPAPVTGPDDAGPGERADWEECLADIECASGACIDFGQDFGSLCSERCGRPGPGPDSPCPFNLSCINDYCQPDRDDGPGGD
jgi:hypothetical protein